MMPKPPIDFKKVDALRRHMLLTTVDMSKLLGVSRMTYYAWVRGGPIRPTNDEFVRTMLRRLLGIMTQHNWPMPSVIASSPKERQAQLLQLLDADK
jgi:DNA-binding XRE family transcriptional regulator